MSFKVKDLSVRLSGPGYEDTSTCTTMTKPTGSGCSISLFFGEAAGLSLSGLAALKAQLHQAMTRT